MNKYKTRFVATKLPNRLYKYDLGELFTNHYNGDQTTVNVVITPRGIAVFVPFDFFLWYSTSLRHTCNPWKRAENHLVLRGAAIKQFGRTIGHYLVLPELNTLRQLKTYFEPLVRDLNEFTHWVDRKTKGK
jgi:hypothetical protein